MAVLSRGFVVLLPFRSQQMCHLFESAENSPKSLLLISIRGNQMQLCPISSAFLSKSGKKIRFAPRE
jgi:hypothetical protein